MKRSMLLSLFFIVSLPIFCMDNKKDTDEFNCCGLNWAVYYLTKNLGRNDYLYLAQANSTWFLEKKIESKEYLDDLDKYYLKLGRFIEGNDVSLFHTPLQEAVKKGSLETVKLLCLAGANAHKKIKSGQQVLDSDKRAREPHSCLFLTSWNDSGEDIVEKKITQFKEENYVGRTALELAIILQNKATDKLSERKEIVNFLQIQNKKD